MREFYLSAQVKNDSFILKHIEYNDYVLFQLNNDRKIENTLFFSRKQLEDLFCIISKKV